MQLIALFQFKPIVEGSDDGYRFWLDCGRDASEEEAAVADLYL